MKLNKIFNQKNLLIIGIFVCLVLIIVSQILSSKSRKTTSVPLIPTPTIEVLTDSNPVENTQEWNTSFNKQISDYESTRNQIADKYLSEIRINSPINISGNTIEYDYRSATYTITLLSPYPENKNIVLLWLKERSIDQKIIQTIRIKWVNKE